MVSQMPSGIDKASFEDGERSAGLLCRLAIALMLFSDHVIASTRTTLK
jgi:hypothetical protein